jgi:hypothetical protein
MTSRERRSSLFRRRIVIAVPEWSVFAVAGAIGIGLFNKPMLVANMLAFILCVLSVVCVWVARRQVRALRYDIHEALNNINYPYAEVEEEIGAKPTLEDYEPEKFHLKRVNGKSSSRVSE